MNVSEYTKMIVRQVVKKYNIKYEIYNRFCVIYLNNDVKLLITENDYLIKITIDTPKNYSIVNCNHNNFYQTLKRTILEQELST